MNAIQKSRKHAFDFFFQIKFLINSRFNFTLKGHSFLDARNEESVAQFKFEQDTFRLIRVGWFTALALTIHNIPGIGMDFVLHKFVPTSSDESLKADPEGM